jgi:hypothetical protein
MRPKIYRRHHPAISDKILSIDSINLSHLLKDTDMIAKQIEALLQYAVKAASAPLRATDLLHIDEKSIRAAYVSEAAPDFPYDDFRAHWIGSNADGMAESLVEIAPHLETISKFHARPEVKLLVQAFRELVYRDGAEDLSTMKYELFLESSFAIPDEEGSEADPG